MSGQAADRRILSEHYSTAQGGPWGADPDLATSPIPPPGWSTITFCEIVMRNGVTVTGVSVCESEGFDADKARAIARQDAVSKLPSLEAGCDHN